MAQLSPTIVVFISNIFTAKKNDILINPSAQQYQLMIMKWLLGRNMKAAIGTSPGLFDETLRFINLKDVVGFISRDLLTFFLSRICFD